MQKRLEEKVAENIKYYELEVDENNQSAEGGGGRSSQADAAAAGDAGAVAGATAADVCAGDDRADGEAIDREADP